MSLTDLLNSNYVEWMNADNGPETDIVISSRIRLARNLSLMPFPHLLDDDSGPKVLSEIKEAWSKNIDKYADFQLITFDQLPSLDREILVEKHLISPEHGKSDKNFQGLLVNNNGSIAIMINEEDHLRLQCILPGLQIEQCYALAQKFDDQLEEYLDFAFDERRGYLTSCPTNVGTGMRASVMLHLPALSITGHTNHIFQNLGQLGMTVRGLYGENSEMLGNFFQLSNQVTLGQAEEDILNNLTIIVTQIIEQERLMRSKLVGETKLQLEDRVGRAYGILTNAKIMTSSEALKHLSDVRLGVDMKILSNIKPFALNQLVVALKPAHLQKVTGQEMGAMDRDILRAGVIKKKIVKNREV
ncbi:MAG TPA: protein arginine kinase [Syntrophomonadaceae bacterium]|nr:protein arginine kinase [Syntrophomonadaceae bacterium]